MDFELIQMIKVNLDSRSVGNLFLSIASGLAR